jgi:hypothetical protein
MEALPGIAAVLRSPVANAIVALSRAGAGLEEFRPAEAEELLRYGVRRNLLTQDEVDRILAEIREVVSHRPAKVGSLVAEKPKKAPTPATPVAEHRAMVPPVFKAAVPAAPVKTPAKPVMKAPAKPAKPASKAPAKAPPAAKAKKAAVKTAAVKKTPAKPAPKKAAAKKGRR